LIGRFQQKQTLHHAVWQQLLQLLPEMLAVRRTGAASVQQLVPQVHSQRSFHSRASLLLLRQNRAGVLECHSWMSCSARTACCAQEMLQMDDSSAVAIAAAAAAAAWLHWDGLTTAAVAQPAAELLVAPQAAG
jgi:hypothetical protein